VSIATAVPGSAQDEHLAIRRRFKIAKVAIAFLFALVLMYAGFQGRQHARLQVRLNEITLLRDQLQQTLDDEQKPAERLVGGVRATAADTGRPPSSNDQVKALAYTLKTRLGPFDADYSPRQLSEVERWELRLSKATLANAEQRFAEALTTITAEDEKGNRASTQAQIGRLVRVLQIRGDSFYGLHEWRDALDRYRPMLMLQPNRIVTRARVTDCHYALGSRNDALTAYGELARSHNNRGDAFLLQGKPDAAIGHYEKAIQIQTRLIEQEGRSALASELAMSHNNRGNAFLVLAKPDAAIGHYERAIQIQTRLIEQEGRSELDNELAASHNNLGNAFLVQGKPDAAVGQYEKTVAIQTRLIEQNGRSELASELAMCHDNLGSSLLGQQKLDAALGHYEKAIAIQTRLIQQEGRSEWPNELALSHNNRGVVRRAQGKPDAAMGDFEQAITILTRFIEQEGRRELADEPARSHNHRGMVHRAQVKLDVAMGYSEQALEALLRPRLLEQGGRRQLAVVLAVSLKNRGYAHLVQGKPDAAIGDFKKAMEIYARLVEHEGQVDLAREFARSLKPLAWIYATSPDNSLRNGSKAREYALKACELSEWKAFVLVETLAAAWAESGNFAEAVKWQEKALELAPVTDKVVLRSRLELYKSGKPCRAPLPKAE
jgi:tetratricopeptide (TPR) repeat protein